MGAFGSLIVTVALYTFALPAGPYNESAELAAHVDSSHHSLNPISGTLATANDAADVN